MFSFFTRHDVITELDVCEVVCTSDVFLDELCHQPESIKLARMAKDIEVGKLVGKRVGMAKDIEV